MKITREEVEKVAHLARLNLTEKEKESMIVDMEAIINFADQINELAVGDVSPTEHVIPINNVFREDVIRPSMKQADLLQNAPNSENGYFCVPKVVE